MNHPPTNGCEPILFTIHLSNNQTFAEISIDQAMHGIRALKLTQYRATGLTDNGTLLFSFYNQPSVDRYTNDGKGSWFPLMFDSFPDQMVILNKPMPVMGKSHVFNGSHKFRIKIERQDGQPLIYTKLDLIFQGKSNFEQSENYHMYQ